MALLLENMKGKTDRKAHFSTVIALTRGDDILTFEGRVDGEITEVPSGTDGFGYDPVFRPDGFDVTFAEMTPDQKNSISHRGRATALLIAYLNTYK